jgi:SAM-dependent methyltransferase
LFHSRADEEAAEMKLYNELAHWYRLIDPPGDHEEEAEVHAQLLARAVPGARTLLELGSGAGHNALYLKRRLACTLTDVSEEMLALNRALNPECEIARGDMRFLRLGRQFDAVLVHDAVMYMTHQGELAAAALTAFEHLRPGGAALFQPDCIRETFRERATVEGADDGARSARFLMWSWDPDPGDDTFVTEFAFLLRDGLEVRAEHDRHLEGLFPRAVWIGILSAVGFEVEVVAGAVPGEPEVEIFLCRRPAEHSELALAVGRGRSGV